MKLAICIPTYGNPETAFMQCLLNLINYNQQVTLTDEKGDPIEIEWDVFIVSGSMLTESRHRLCAEALAWGADYMLCLDADHIFPPDAFARLWAHNKAVVGCNYPRRATPTAPTAAIGDHLLYTTEEKANEGVVEQCSHMGFGVVLINMKVFDALQAQAEKEGEDSFLPIFLFRPQEDKVGMIGEDVFFFEKLAKAGIKPWLDHALSWEVGHIHKVHLMNAHACTQKERWEETFAKRGERITKALEEAES